MMTSFKLYMKNMFQKTMFSNKGIPEWLGGIFIGIVNVFFLAWANKPFTIYSGYLNWGQHIYTFLGLSSLSGIPSDMPLLNKTSVGDIGLFLGAFTAAILSHEFKIKKISSKIDFLEAITGGLLMALGVVFAVGCNWGGFFSAITVLSLHGFFMLIGLFIGGLLGLKYVEWKAKRIIEIITSSNTTLKMNEKNKTSHLKITSKIGLSLTIIIISIIIAYQLTLGEFLYTGILAMGFTVGIILQRSRFCFASAFRDVFGGPEFSRSIALQKGIILALLIGVSGSFIFKYLGYIDPMTYVKPVGISNIIGGILFGFGMVIAGSCASGSLWRAAEGHTKLWITLIVAVLSYPIFVNYVHTYFPWIFGPKIFIPYAFGWGLGLLITYFLLGLWLLLLLYLEYKKFRRRKWQSS